MVEFRRKHETNQDASYEYVYQVVQQNRSMIILFLQSLYLWHYPFRGQILLQSFDKKLTCTIKSINLRNKIHKNKIIHNSYQWLNKMSPALRRRRRQQEQMMQMQAMSNPSMFFYLGDIANLDRKLQETMAQGIPITDIYIRVTGVQVSQFNLCLLMVTIMLGAFFILPLFAMCYDCWKKSVYPTYEVPTYVYQKLQCIISTQCVRTIFIEVCDNNLNRQKGQILYQLLSMSSAQSFILSNSAANMDFKEDQYSNFVDNMKPIKMLPLQSTVKWWTQIVS